MFTKPGYHLSYGGVRLRLIGSVAQGTRFRTFGFQVYRRGGGGGVGVETNLRPGLLMKLNRAA